MWVIVFGILLALLLWWSLQKKFEPFEAIRVPFRYIRISSPTTVSISQFSIISHDVDITLRNQNIQVDGEKPDWQIDLREDEIVDKIVYKGNASPGMTMMFYASNGSKVGDTVTFTGEEDQEFDLKNSSSDYVKLQTNELSEFSDLENLKMCSPCISWWESLPKPPES